MNITDFDPYDIAGFTLNGKINKDTGYVELQKKKLKNIPETIECNGVSYTLEYVDRYDDEEFEKYRQFNAEYV